MTSFQIKLLAIITMVIDHVGLFFFPHLQIFHIIGRLAFPLFAWLIAKGAKYTSNINHYLFRLLVFALLSQVPYIMTYRLIDPSFERLNIFFTLLIGLAAIWVIKKNRNKIVWIIATLVGSIIAHFFEVDFGIMGVLSIIAFYIFSEKPTYLITSQVLIYLSPIMYFVAMIPLTDVLQMMKDYNYYAPLAIFSLIIVFLYNKKQGPKMKYFFYTFYPLQYIVIYLLKNLS